MLTHYISNTPEGKDFFEGKSQHLVAHAIYDTINSCTMLPHIMGLEGDWGSGKSNVIKQLSAIDNFDKKYYLFTYDAWGHQEDLQRRSILEVLTTELIKKDFLQGKGKVRLRNGEVKEDKWSSLLSYLLSNKTVTTTRPTVKATSFTIMMLLIVCLAHVTSTISSDKFADCEDNTYLYWVVLLAPYLLGMILIGVYAYSSCSLNFLKQWVTKEDSERVTEEYVSSEEPSIQEFRNWMQAISDYIDNNHKQKLILVFDNMDRLAPEKVRQLWSSIYAFFAGEVFDNIWVVIPYDEKHLVKAFSEGDSKEGDNFIKKTFSMVYRVSPPVISDYELLFKAYFEEAFGEHEDENRINQIFRVLNPNPNPRDVIYFLNQMVSLVRMWDEKIPLADIALYVCRKVTNHKNGRKLDEYLLSNDIFENVEGLFVHQERTKVNLAKLAYGLTNDELARQLPMRNYLRAFFEEGGGLDINEYANHPHFVTVLTDVINDAPLTLTNKYIGGLGKLDIRNLSEEGKSEITHKWDYLANQWKKVGIGKLEFGEELHFLLSNCSEKNKQGLIKVIVADLQNYSDFKGEDYFHAMDKLSKFLDVQNIVFDFSQIEWIKVPGDVFLDYLNVAKQDYLRYHLYTTSEDLISSLSDTNLKSYKRPELVEYLVNDLRYSFKSLYDFCKKLIENEDVDKDNICSLLYFISFELVEIEKRSISAVKDLPKVEVFENLYPLVYDQPEYLGRPGYWDFIFLSMILAGKQPVVADECIDELARISAKYARFYHVFDNLSDVYTCRQKMAASIIRQKIVGNLNLRTTIEKMSIIQLVTEISWSDILNYFSLYVDDLMKEEQEKIMDDMETLVPCNIFPKIKDVDCKLVRLIVSIGRECLKTGEHYLFNSSGVVVDGYWNDFVVSFLGTNSWNQADGYLLKELVRVFNLYCDNHDISLVNNEFVQFILDRTSQSDVIPIMNRVRNGFTIGNREATVEEFCYFVHYFPKITNEIPNKETFVQNFIEYAFITDETCRISLSYYAEFYMALINHSSQIAQRIIKFIVENKASETTCGKLYSMLSEEVIDSLKLKEKDKQ